MAGLMCDCRRRSSAALNIQIIFLDVLFPLLLRMATLHHCIIYDCLYRQSIAEI